MDRPRSTNPTLPIAEQNYDDHKKDLDSVLSDMPSADDNPDTYLEWSSVVKNKYAIYLRCFTQLARCYRNAAATDSLKNLNEEKGNLKSEVNSAIELTNNILEKCDRDDVVSDVMSSLSLNLNATVQNVENLHGKSSNSNNYVCPHSQTDVPCLCKFVRPSNDINDSFLNDIATPRANPKHEAIASSNALYSYANLPQSVPHESLTPSHQTAIPVNSISSTQCTSTYASPITRSYSSSRYFPPSTSAAHIPMLPVTHNLYSIPEISGAKNTTVGSRLYSQATPKPPTSTQVPHIYRMSNMNHHSIPISQPVENPYQQNNYYSVQRNHHVPQGNRSGARTIPYSVSSFHAPPVAQALPPAGMDPASFFLIKQELFKRPVKPFTGDPSDFLVWHSTLQNRMKDMPLSSLDILTILEAHTEGAPQTIVRDTMAVGAANPDQAVQDCWEMLWDRYGAGGQVTETLITKLDSITPIKYVNQVDKLYELLVICKMISSNMQTSPDLLFFNSTLGKKRIFFKLPERLQDAWRDYEITYEEKHFGNGAPFIDLVSFLSAKIKKYSLPSYKASPWVVNTDKSGKNPSYNHNTVKKISNANSFQTDKVSKPEASAPVDKQGSQSHQNKCILHAEGKHDLKDCRVFSNKPYDEKRKLCFQSGLCYSCLGRHRQADCSGTQKCSTCNGKHLSVMHNERVTAKKQTDNNEKSDSPNDNSQDKSSLCTAICGNKSTLRSCSKTVLVTLENRKRPGIYLKCYCIIDEQSSSCFATSAVARHFGITTPSIDYYLNTLSGYQNKFTGVELTDFFIKGVGEKKGFYLPKMVTNDSIVNNRDEIASPQIVAAHPHVAHLSKYFNEVDESAGIMLLLGRDCGAAMRTKCHGHKAPYAHHTSLGWALVGQTCIQESVPPQMSVMRVNYHESLKIQPCFTEPALKPLNPRNIFEECSNDEHSFLSQNEQRFINIVSDNISVDKDRHIVIPLPFKSCKHPMPDNRHAVYHRTNNTLQRMRDNKNKLEQCLNTMGKYIACEHVEKIPDNEELPLPGKYWHIPVFPVTHPKKGKVRIVFDSSAKYKGTSLNDQLLTGPDVLNNLRSVLLHFREAEVGFIADVESMFHNFVLPPEDRNYVCFYWFDKNNPDNAVVRYRATRHIFGNSSSPALATLGLRFAIKNANPSSSAIAEDLIFNKCYVDDCVASCYTAEEAIEVLQNARDSLIQFKIRLHKIQSNSSAVLKAFPVTECAFDPESMTGETVTSALGVSWDTQSDKLIMKLEVPEHPFTKRGVLATINSIFDPYGLVSPIVLEGRLIQRSVLPSKSHPNPNTENLDWDDEIPKELSKSWNEWKSSLKESPDFTVNRSHLPPGFGIPIHRELHAFGDASSNGTGYVIYLRCINGSNNVAVSFVLGNSRVPTQLATSIPRMELCAAADLAGAAHNVASTLHIPYDCVSLYSDSNVVLGYLNNKCKRFSIYVTRRVNLILKHFPEKQWRYISTNLNPADMASRPQSPTALLNSCWLTGPTFLHELIVPSTGSTVPETDLPEVKADLNVMKSETLTNPSIVTKFSEHCSTLQNFLSRLSYVLCYFIYISDIARQNKGELLAPRIFLSKEHVLNFSIKFVQQECFSELYASLFNKKKFTPSKSLSALSPFMDEFNLIRVGGRLRNSTLATEIKHPVLLPEKHALSARIVNHYHCLYKHQGRSVTLGAIRNAGYYIVHLSKLVKKEINNCFTCKRLRGSLLNQVMSDLPSDRLEETPPFTNTGLDVCGPFHITDGTNTRRHASNKKLWAMLFTCLVSRATHIEPLPMMDTSSCVNALRRFFALRGIPRRLRSDQGTNFIGTFNQSATICLTSVQKELPPDCTWEFNPPKAPHFGGVWERQIGTFKRILDSCLLRLGLRLPSRDEMCTFFQEAAAIMNNTPLYPISSNPNDEFPITPAMLLTSKTNSNPAPPETFSEKDHLAYGSRRWRRVQILAEQFFKDWRSEYLTQITKRQKWHQHRRNLRVGDVVLIKDVNVKRNIWPLARVTDVHPSKDGFIRSVTVRTSDGSMLLRPVTCLVLLSPYDSEVAPATSSGECTGRNRVQ